MEQDLEKLKEIYLSSDVDEEDREDNLERIREWEKTIAESTSLSEWQNHDITKSIALKIKSVYIENALILGTNDLLDEDKRKEMWSIQKAIKFLLSYMDNDYKRVIDQVHGDIKKAIALQE